MNLKYTLADAQEAGMVPWKDPIQEDFHVVIYADKYPVTEGHLLFVPQYAADGVIEDCFADALKVGKQKVKSGEWDGFNMVLIGEKLQDKLYHIRMYILYQDAKEIWKIPLAGFDT